MWVDNFEKKKHSSYIIFGIYVNYSHCYSHVSNVLLDDLNNDKSSNNVFNLYFVNYCSHSSPVRYKNWESKICGLQWYWNLKYTTSPLYIWFSSEIK